ncbi:MAG: UbiA-like protein EboC [Gammaproteobacteria bacterium]
MNEIIARGFCWWAWAQLMRPANVVTALADVLAGFAASGAAMFLFAPSDPSVLAVLAWLLVATTALYAGGVVFNDVFDAELDAIERPERPIPGGLVSRRAAAAFGALLLLCGVLAALQVSAFSAALAAAVALAAITYDAYGQHLEWLGPLNMGACRGLNLVLGMSAIPASVPLMGFLALIPIAYIAAITLISRGEVHGGTRATGVAALGLTGTLVAGILLLGVTDRFALIAASPFLLLFTWFVVPAFVKAARQPSPERIRTAVKTGVIMLIALNAALAAGFAGIGYGLIVLSLLPVSMGLARAFAVT